MPQQSLYERTLTRAELQAARDRAAAMIFQKATALYQGEPSSSGAHDANEMRWNTEILIDKLLTSERDTFAVGELFHHLNSYRQPKGTLAVGVSMTADQQYAHLLPQKFRQKISDAESIIQQLLTELNLRTEFASFLQAQKQSSPYQKLTLTNEQLNAAAERAKTKATALATERLGALETLQLEQKHDFGEYTYKIHMIVETFLARNTDKVTALFDTIIHAINITDTYHRNFYQIGAKLLLDELDLSRQFDEYARSQSNPSIPALP